MDVFRRVNGIAAVLDVDNVDTDAIIPSRETQSVARTGYGAKLFANWRYIPGTQTKNPDFVLNQPPFDRAEILVSGRNFGCGSSREAAAWSLKQFGIKCVIAESFGAIFRNNCIRNGLLPVSLPSQVLEELVQELDQAARGTLILVDLEKCLVRLPKGEEHRFTIGNFDREMLLNGADEIALTLLRRDAIDAFRKNDHTHRRWIYEFDSARSDRAHS